MAKKQKSNVSPSTPIVLHKNRRGKCSFDGKVTYVDWVAAELAIQHIQKNARRTIHDENRYYWCNHAGGYHLTSQDQLTEYRSRDSA